jgi:hypothetical protein
VGVRIDQPRKEAAARGIDRALAGKLARRGHRRDALPVHGHVGAQGLFRVDHQAAAHQQIVFHRSRS